MRPTSPVDPDFAPVLELLPPGGVDVSDIANVRKLMRATRSAASLPDGVVAEDRQVPGPEGAPSVGVRVLRPTAARADRPALLWIHGGGYVAGGADLDDDRLGPWAAALDAVVVSVEYRLAPEDPYPAGVEDCDAALRWLHHEAADLGVDPTRIVIGGGSAGGGLCAALALVARDRGEVPVRAQLLIYPMLDDRAVTASSAWDAPVWNARSNGTGWRSYLGPLAGGDDVPAYAAAGRATDLAGLPPALVVVGSVDLFLDEDLAYARRLLEAGVPTELHVYPGAIHGFDSPGIGGLAAVSRRALADEQAWLERMMAPDA